MPTLELPTSAIELSKRFKKSSPFIFLKKCTFFNLFDSLNALIPDEVPSDPASIFGQNHRVVNFNLLIALSVISIFFLESIYSLLQDAALLPNNQQISLEMNQHLRILCRDQMLAFYFLKSLMLNQ